MESGFYFNSILFTLFVYSQTILCQQVSPLLDLCDDSLVDTAVQTFNGQVYIFKGEHYFEFSLNQSQLISVGKPFKDWLNLPKGIQASFLITDSSNPLYGSSFFFKQDHWYQYRDKNFVTSGSTGRWVIDPIYARYILPMFNESVYGFFSLASPQISLGPKIFNWFHFHNPFNPNHIPTGSLVYPFFSIDLYQVKAIVDYSLNEWLIFFDDGYNGYFCILKNLQGDCTEKYIWDSPICPDLLKYFVEDSILLKALERLPVSLDRLFSLIFSILSSIAVILVIFIIGLTTIIIDFIKIKNRTKLFQLLLERQKHPNQPYISFGKHLLRTAEQTFRGPDPNI